MVVVSEAGSLASGRYLPSVDHKAPTMSQIIQASATRIKTGVDYMRKEICRRRDAGRRDLGREIEYQSL